MSLPRFKVCVLGEAAVGKSTLVSTFVQREFDTERRVRSGAQVEVGTADSPLGLCELGVWDVLCADGGFALETSYLTGVAGAVIVCDRTRRPTVTAAKAMIDRLRDTFGPVPVALAINKSDLAGSAEVSEDEIETLRQKNPGVFSVSATSGEQVNAVFSYLAARLNRDG